jgi:hypothetical protein
VKSIQSAKYITEHGGQAKNFSIFGQEKNLGTWAICKMNMLLHGFPDAHIEKGDTIRVRKRIKLRFSIPIRVVAWQDTPIKERFCPIRDDFKAPATSSRCWGSLDVPMRLIARAGLPSGLGTGWIYWVGSAFVRMIRRRGPSLRVVTDRNLQLQSRRARGLKQRRTCALAREGVLWAGGPCIRGCALRPSAR